jgi:hypothetical protein
MPTARKAQPGALYIRLSADELEQLADLARRLRVTRHGLARSALLIGLDAVADKPALLAERPPPKMGRPRKDEGEQKPKGR